MQYIVSPGAEVRATIENPRISLNDPNDWEDLGVVKSAAGVGISAEKALTYSPWWRGINIISRDVGKLPCCIFRRKGRGKEPATDHKAYYLVRRKPNSFQTAIVFRQQLTAHALSWGNGYAYIFRKGNGDPVELLPLDPSCTFPVRVNAVLWYVTSANGEQRKLPAEDVLHVKGLSFDGLSGYSVYKKAKEDLGGGLGLKRFSNTFFGNNARPNMALEVPVGMTEAAILRLRDSWERVHQGLDNAHRTAILRDGVKLQTYSTNARDARLVEQEQYSIRDIANWIGVPAHKLGDTTRTSFASLEQENQSYLDDSLDFWLCNWEEESWDKLLTEEEKQSDSHVVEFLRAALLRADLTARSNYYRTALAGAPWMTRNEVRDAESMDPLEGGDEILDPANMGAQGGADNDPNDPAADPPGGQEGQRSLKLTEAHRALLTDAVRRMVARVATHARRASRKPAEFLTWIDDLEAEHLPAMRAALVPAAEACGAVTGVDPPGLADDLLEGLRQDLLTVSGQVTAGQLGDAVNRLCQRWEAERPGEVAAAFFAPSGPTTRKTIPTKKGA